MKILYNWGLIFNIDIYMINYNFFKNIDGFGIKLPIKSWHAVKSNQPTNEKLNKNPRQKKTKNIDNTKTDNKLISLSKISLFLWLFLG